MAVVDDDTAHVGIWRSPASPPLRQRDGDGHVSRVGLHGQ
ncbi:hypothetical protein HNQ99_001256 [Rhizorhapis suberifaciens]|uniref:Uncharacterized protein n=1 Tax=Rhizorhapis suberifaciens TaxID=13656 RepID=A0A840HS29_9SPHN|nr:hypothetical protein [Rhizorhapis suberifaciens]